MEMTSHKCSDMEEIVVLLAEAMGLSSGGFKKNAGETTGDVAPLGTIKRWNH